MIKSADPYGGIEDQTERTERGLVHDALLGKLGRFKTGKSCLYLNKIEDIDMTTLKELITLSVEHVATSNS